MSSMQSDVESIKTSVSAIKNLKKVIENLSVTADEIKTFVNEPRKLNDEKIITFEELKTTHNLGDLLLPILTNENYHTFINLEKKKH